VNEEVPAHWGLSRQKQTDKYTFQSSAHCNKQLQTLSKGKKRKNESTEPERRKKHTKAKEVKKGRF